MEFTYRAIQDGKTVTGTIESESADGAAASLKGNNVTILSIEQKTAPISSSFTSIFSKVSFSNVVDFTRQMSIMLNSGLTLIDSLDILKRQSENTAFLKLIQEIDNDVKAGVSFSDSLRKHPKQFSNLYISLVKAGEASGKLDEILSKLAETLERQRTFNSKVKSAMIYPIVVVTAILVVMFIMVTFVLPQLLTIYKQFDVELPAMTVVLINVSDFFNAYWPIIVIGVFAFVALMIRVLKSKAGKRYSDTISLHIPVINRIVKISALVDSTRTLSILISAGVSILEALDIITETTSNVIYQEAFIVIKHQIETGETLGNALEQQHIFPPILVQMTAVGEQTGHMDETLGHLANYFESESEIAMKTLTTLIEPLLLIVMGISVGFVVTAVITPIFNLTASF